MKSAAFVLAALLVAAPAHAQFGGVLNKAQKVKDATDKIKDLHFSDKEEWQLGEKISANLVQKFGVYQDEKVTKYVSLVGNVIAQQSSRSNLTWTFIVLDTEGVNAFAAPGGIIHVTKGLLGLMKYEGELAGVLGHEITHVVEKHTIDSIKKDKEFAAALDYAPSAGGGITDSVIDRFAQKGFDLILNGQFSQSQENDADKEGIRLANKVGYSPAGMIDVLKKIDARNASSPDRNGMFASHPATSERIDKLTKQIGAERLSSTATVQTRYAANVTFDAMPITEIATDVAGAAGLAGSDGKSADKKDDKDKDKDKKKGSNPFSKIGLTGNTQAQNTGTVAAGGARGGVPDRDAKGGPNKNKLTITVTPAELDAFKKGIVA